MCALITFDQVFPGIVHNLYMLIQTILKVTTVLTFIAIKPLFTPFVSTSLVIPQCCVQTSFKLAHITFQTLFSMFLPPMISHFVYAIKHSCMKVTPGTLECFSLVFFSLMLMKTVIWVVMCITFVTYVAYHFVFSIMMPVESSCILIFQITLVTFEFHHFIWNILYRPRNFMFFFFFAFWMTKHFFLCFQSFLTKNKFAADLDHVWYLHNVNMALKVPYKKKSI